MDHWPSCKDYRGKKEIDEETKKEDKEPFEMVSIYEFWPKNGKIS